MSRNEHDQQQPESWQSPEPGTDPTAVASVEKTETPEAVQAAQEGSRRGADRSGAAQRLRGVRGVEWVRPTDLLARHGAAVAGRGIDFEVELARRTRTATATEASVRGVRDRARRLPPLSSFGRSQTVSGGPSRSGVGLS